MVIFAQFFGGTEFVETSIDLETLAKILQAPRFPATSDESLPDESGKSRVLIPGFSLLLTIAFIIHPSISEVAASFLQ